MQKKKLMMLAAVVAVLAVVGIGVTTALVVSDASGYSLQSGIDNAKGEGMSNQTNVEVIVKNIINVILYAAGILSVGFLVFGGIKYVTSSGDSSKVKAAKDTILYAVIGLMVTILAFVIVNFVIDAINGGGGGGDSTTETKNKDDDEESTPPDVNTDS